MTDVDVGDPVIKNELEEGPINQPEPTFPVDGNLGATEDQQGGQVNSAEDGHPMSKNQLKKLKRKQQWEEGREQRKVIRKQKTKQRKARKREEHRQKSSANGKSSSTAKSLTDTGSTLLWRKNNIRAIQVPVTFLLDCQFDDFMTDNERISLSTQLTRCYSDNRKAEFKAHLAVSSFGGQLKERFDGLLAKAHEGWQGVRFFDQDFVAVADMASIWMQEPGGGNFAGALSSSDQKSGSEEKGEIVYLTSDSPDTLHRLCPYSTYVVGALVDKNRHKGICYKKAMDRSIRTAKLPIGEYMQMQSRFVLTTNQVIEIMLRWLQLGDWGEAFLSVIPKRKGGALKEQVNDAAAHAGDDSCFVGDVSSTEDKYTPGEDYSEETKDKGLIDAGMNNATPGSQHEEVVWEPVEQPVE